MTTHPPGNGETGALPQRRRTRPPGLPDWSDPAHVRAWIFRPVPVPYRPAVDMAVVQRVYEWMVEKGWGSADARQ